MKYYLDVNALVHLIERKKEKLYIYKDAYISTLVIDEMLKNLEKNYQRQRNQFLFLKENRINIDWRSCDTVMFLEPFGFPLVYNNPYIKVAYNNILKYENYKDYSLEGLSEDSMDGLVRSMVVKSLEGIVANQLGYLTSQIKYRKILFEKNKPYEIKKMLLKEWLETGIKIICDKYQIEKKTEKDRYRTRGMKHYFASDKYIDFYFESTIETLKKEEIDRNDGSDLYHLAYINRKEEDVFVTDDYDLRKICNKISTGSAIDTSEFIENSK